MIDCAAFEAIVDRLLSGEFSPDESEAVEDHAADCARCAELLALLRGAGETVEASGEGEMAAPLGRLDPLDAGAETDLVAGILDRTSGSPCGRAELLLCDRVDGVLPDAEDELLDLHLDHCAGCAELAAALTTLRADLPAMAELEPDPWFVRDVLDATTRREPRGFAEPARAAAQSIGSWSRRLLERPRLAIELAYSGAMVIFLLWGTPVSPLRGTAEKALSVMRADPAEGIAGAYESGSYLAGQISSRAHGMWDLVGSPLAHDVNGFWVDLRREGADRLAVLSIADRYAGRIWRAMWGGDLVEAGRILGLAREELRARDARRAKETEVKSDRTREGPAP